MAKQRQTDVNIRYNVDTVKLERGNALLEKASRSTDNLQQASDAYAKTAGAGNQRVSTSIAGLTLQMQRLKAQIELANRSDTQRLAQLSRQYKAVKAQVDAYNKALFQTATASKSTANATQNMASQFGQVYTAIKLFIAAGLARELVNITLEMAKLSGNTEGVERAFMRAFPGGVSILNDLREATHGTVTDFELMQRTLQATNLGVSVEHLAVLFEFAATRAQQTGESVDYLVDSIVRGIGRKSALVLDNLGLSAIRLKQHFGGVALQALSVGTVTEGVAEIAKEELGKMGGYLETSATQVDQLTVGWRTFKTELAKFSTEGAGGGIIGWLQGYVDSFKVLIKSFNEGKTVSEVFADQQREQIAIISANEFMTRRFTESKEENIKILQEEIQAITNDLGAYVRFKESIEERNAKRKEELKIMDNHLIMMADGQKLQTKEFIELKKDIELRDQLLEKKKDDALIDQEILRLLQSKLLALKAVNKEEDKEDGGKRGMLMKPLTEVVDIRFKDPVTGTISKDHVDKVLTDLGLHMQALTDSLPPVTLKLTPFLPIGEWEKALDENRDQIVESSTGIIQDQIDSIMQADIDAYSARIDAARDFYGEQIALAGDNERAKDEIRIKEARKIKELEKARADREKKSAKAGIVVSTALGVMKVFAGEGTFWDKIIKAAIVAAEGASQYTIASQARYYAKGDIDIKGGTPGKDSIPAMLMPHESIMTAEETKSSRGIFKAIRARKLNDRMLKEIVSGRSGGSQTAVFDDTDILKKLDEVKNATPDITRRANLIYETKKKGDNYKQTVRSKSMGL